MKVARYQIKGMFFTCFLRHHEIWRSGVFVCTCDRRPLVLRCWHFSRPLAKRCPVSPHCTLHATIFFLFCCMPRKLVIHVVIRPDPESMRHVLFLFNFIFFLFFGRCYVLSPPFQHASHCDMCLCPKSNSYLYTSTLDVVVSPCTVRRKRVGTWLFAGSQYRPSQKEDWECKRNSW